MDHRLEIEEFLQYLKAELRSSVLTAEAYGRDLRQFADYMRQKSGSTSADICGASVRDVRGWIGSLADNGDSATTLRRKLQSLRAFYVYGMKIGALQGNPAADVTLPKKRKPLPNFIKDSEVEEVLHDNDGSFNAERRHIVIELLYSLGLRRAEIIALTDSDIQFGSMGEIRVTGKRNKTRIVPMPESLAADIARWQGIRDKRYPDLPEPRALIAGPHGAVSTVTLHKIVNEALATTTTGRKSPHTLRHTFATTMISNGADLDAVREMLGHESLATTQIYTHLSVKELMAGYAKAHPRTAAKGDES